MITKETPRARMRSVPNRRDPSDRVGDPAVGSGAEATTTASLRSVSSNVGRWPGITGTNRVTQKCVKWH
jgi:hypothetical protein